jgi:hypothetical protein
MNGSRTNGPLTLLAAFLCVALSAWYFGGGEKSSRFSPATQPGSAVVLQADGVTPPPPPPPPPHPLGIGSANSTSPA